MAQANADTQEVLNRADTQIKSLDRAPSGAAAKTVIDLERTTKKLYDILQKAHAYCGSHPENDVAFDRYKEVLDTYVRASDSVANHRDKQPSYQ